ncbi:hypothetical protein [Novosphingobium sp.]|uniref:hypothetical protein n=1 Tax=Novosphingobium sp. TaxID=1874826 RepID=UPI0031D6E14B
MKKRQFERFCHLFQGKVIALKSRHSTERLLIAALRHLAAPQPGPARGKDLLREAGTSERGISTLSALMTLLPRSLPIVRLHDIASPFVSEGEIFILGELALRQRTKPEPMRGGARWPIDLEPALNLLFEAAARALADAGLVIFHRTIFSALQRAHDQVPRRGIMP